MILNLPNIITLFRILMIPLFVGVFYLPTPWAHQAAAIIFAIAAVTDWLDGYLARHWSQTTRFGAFLDPVADKLIVAVALVLVVGERTLPAITIPAAIIVGREIIISALREWMAELGKRMSVAVSLMGKFKTLMQMIALILLLVYTPQTSKMIGIIGSLLLYLAAVLTLWSMILYLKVAWPDLTLAAEKQ
jgi:CDP-diacylglycerol--glycerol-3-phosphate 3-phosphatidyltransferase